MGKVADYGYANAKLRARIGNMHDSNIIEDMIKAPNLVESIAVLRGTRHNSLIDVYRTTGDIEQVELALLSEEIANYREVAGMLSPRSAAFVRVLLEKVEIENLKNALRMFYSEVVRKHSIKYRATYLYRAEIVNSINWDMIINAVTYDEVLLATEGTPYYDVLSTSSIAKINAKGLFDLEIALDHLYFDQLFRAIKKLKKKDSEIASSIFDVDIDLKNILLLVRYGYYHEVGIDELERVFIPHGRIYNGCVKNEIFSSPDFARELRALLGTHYKEAAVEIDKIIETKDEMTRRDEVASSILHIEKFLGEIRSKEYRRILSKDPLTIGVVLAYIFLSSQEDSLIRAVLSAKFYKWSEEKIREAVV